TLDDSYKQEDSIAAAIKDKLTAVMAKFGYCIENALVTQIIPSDAVTNAMNDINTARRERIATEARAEMNKNILVKNAEGEADAKALAGEGVARERKAIVDGLRDSVKDFELGISGVDHHAVMATLMMTQYFDALREIGRTNAVILMPHSPSAVQDLYGQLRDAIATGVLTASKTEEKKGPQS
ncbi:MAG TPA: SPFH domain-containing protein, partial [Candidatus Acidoferrales bacterium]|nr:SPFH domain-containing protein [Candidatus Acidoferrales bacterium]